MSSYNAIDTGISGLYLLEPKIFKDNRGFFLESYNKNAMEAFGIIINFCQDNHSMSSKGVLRGLHFQSQHPQDKLVRVVSGKTYDVAVDLRPDSSTYLKWFSAELTGENGRMMFIPAGFAHGFLSLEDNTHFLYKVSDYYYPEYDAGLRYDDQTIGITWPDLKKPYIISPKDLNLPTLCQATAQGGSLYHV